MEFCRRTPRQGQAKDLPAAVFNWSNCLGDWSWMTESAVELQIPPQRYSIDVYRDWRALAGDICRRIVRSRKADSLVTDVVSCEVF
jgi:hypothetical protein